MTFAPSDIKKIALLSRLSWNEDELSHVQKDMQRMLDLVTQLSEVSVEGVKPMSHAGDRCLDFRDDKDEEVLGRLCVKSSAGYEDGLIRVPKIIE
jgi:aspartyl-tRNA(Asn)/glutamyl-tRNA(Gln) amidotransferase subunit C